MLSFSGSLKVFVAVDTCDMRKGFNGLHALVTERLGEDPRQGALFVFSNRRHTRIKVLGGGEATKKFVVKADAFSASAKEKIEKKGGRAESPNGGVA